MDALTLLTADHNRVRGLFARFRTAQEAEDTATMATLAGQMRTELDVHTSIEEDVFYPWVRELSGDLSDTIDEGLEEHHVVKLLLAELADLTPDDDAWVAKWTVVIENVEHHAEEEESELFPGVRGASTADQREEQAAALEAAKRSLGAPTLQDTIDLTTTDLRRLASEQEIPGRSTMDHEELAATVAPPTA